MLNVPDDLARVLDILASEDVPHMVVGALALDGLDVPRMTRDVDLQVEAEPPSPGKSTFLGLVVEERTRDEVFDQEVLVAHLPTSGTPFELCFTTHAFTRQALERRREGAVAVLGRPVPLPTVEDFLVLKAAYHEAPGRRPRKRAQDGVDLENVILGHGDRIDWSYVEARARDVGCWDVLEEIRDDIREDGQG